MFRLRAPVRPGDFRVGSRWGGGWLVRGGTPSRTSVYSVVWKRYPSVGSPGSSGLTGERGKQLWPCGLRLSLGVGSGVVAGPFSEWIRGACEGSWDRLRWLSRRGSHRGAGEAQGTGLWARLRRRWGGEKEANHPLTSPDENNKLVGCH